MIKTNKTDTFTPAAWKASTNNAIMNTITSKNNSSKPNRISSTGIISIKVTSGIKNLKSLISDSSSLLTFVVYVLMF